MRQGDENDSRRCEGNKSTALTVTAASVKKKTATLRD